MTFYGPAVLFLKDYTDMRDNGFHVNNLDDIAIVITQGFKVGAGTIVVRDTKVKHCTFYRISFLMVAEDKEKWRQDFAGQRAP